MNHPVFVKQIERSLAHWQKQADAVTDLTLQTAISDIASLLQSIQIGVQCAQTRAQAVDLILSLQRYIMIKGYWQVWIEILRATLAYSLSDRVRIKLLNELGFMLQKYGENADAIKTSKQAVRLSKEKNYPDLIVLTQSYLCAIYVETSNFGEAYQLGNAIVEQLPNGSTEKASLLNSIGLSASWLGKNDEAIDFYEQATLIWEACGAHTYLGRTLMNWGTVLFTQKKSTAYSQKFDAAYQQFKLTNSHIDMAHLSMNKGINLAREGKMEMTKPLFKDALRIVRAFSCPLTVTGDVLMNNGRLFSLLGDPDKARSLLSEALDIWGKLEDEPKYANTLLELGIVAEPEQAVTLWQEAKSILDEQPQENVFVQECLRELAELMA